MIDGLHLLRPWWLAALPVVLGLAWALSRAHAPGRAWRGVIAPHLLEALLVGRERRGRLRPGPLIGVGWALTVLSLAGPAWRREPAPFAEERAALVLVLDLGPSMSAQDVPPSRVVRATQKIGDLLDLRAGTDVALVAYSGSAHRVMPLTRDGEVLAGFAASLSPELMPRAGDVCAEALALAHAELARSGRTGSIVLLTDGTSAEQVDAALAAPGVPVHVLAVGRPPPDDEALRRLASETGGAFVGLTADAADVERLAAAAARDVGRATVADEGDVWRDEGLWLLPLVALAMLVFARRGFVLELSGGST